MIAPSHLGAPSAIAYSVPAKTTVPARKPQLGTLTRHPALTMPVLVKGLFDEGNCYDFLARDVAFDAVEAYDAHPDAQDALAETSARAPRSGRI